MYTAYVLTQESREKLLERFPLKYDTFFGHHITVEFGVSEEHARVPGPAAIKVVGYVDNGTGLEALVVSVNGTVKRPDGQTYHVTWSLNGEEHKPVDSNALLKSKRYTLIRSIKIEAEPKLLR